MNKNMLRICVLSIFLSACSNFDRVEERARLNWNYDYSSDVVHAITLRNTVSRTNNGECNVRYSEFRVIESFKGTFKVGDIIKASGISAHEYTDEGTEQFLLLKPFIAKHYPGYGECSNEEYEEYLSIHNWCCSINTEEERSLVMYDMINSEQSGPRYLVPVADVFRELRKMKHKKSSNK